MTNYSGNDHLERIRSELKRTERCVSVMVGSGFSISAAKGQFNSMPTWRHVAKEMAIAIGKDPNDIAGADFPRIAEEFDAELGRDALHHFLETIIRDQDFSPGPMHEQLLRIRWKNIFTTNWDTLIERALHMHTDIEYGVVHEKEYIARAKYPRIYKLHGTLPDRTPLICTEEDYRKYPQKYAPFLNTVQQAMIDTTFCLLGFSGDDPNFQRWSSWVRDNMGKSSANFYMLGYLNLTNAEKKRLWKFKITPVDMAEHPASSNVPESERYRWGTQYVLNKLSYNDEDQDNPWSIRRVLSSPIQIAPYINRPNTNLGDRDEEKSLYSYPSQNMEIWKSTETTSPPPDVVVEEHKEVEDTDEIALKKIKCKVEEWKRTRESYPNWIILPHRESGNFVNETRVWEPRILSATEKLELGGKIATISELAWRYDIAMDWISLELEERIRSVIAEWERAKDKKKNRCDLVVLCYHVRFLYLVLLTDCRIDGDRTKFDDILLRLNEYATDEYTENRIIHEKCLWHALEIEYEDLSRLVDAWSTHNIEPIWTFRRASLLLELGRLNEAKLEIDKGIKRLKTHSLEVSNLSSTSQLGWGLWWQYIIEFQESNSRHMLKRLSSNSVLIDEIEQKWRDLGRLMCDARSDWYTYSQGLESNSSTLESRPFDIHVRRVRGLGYSRLGYVNYVNGYRLLRITELAGLPISFMGVQLSADILTKVAINISSHHPGTAVRILLRTVYFVSNAEKVVEIVLPRHRVATLEIETVNALYYSAMRLVDSSKDFGSSRGEEEKTGVRVQKMKCGLLILSHLVLRVSEECKLQLLDLALDLYRVPHIYRSIQLNPALYKVLFRTWESLSGELRKANSLRILNLPIHDIDGYHVDSTYACPEPATVLDREDVAFVMESPRDDWIRIVNLITRGLESGIEARLRSLQRLLLIANIVDKLGSNEVTRIAKSIWDDEHIESGVLLDTFTSEKDSSNRYQIINDCYCIVLPSLDKQECEARYRNNWLRGAFDGAAKRLATLGDAIVILRNEKGSFISLSLEEVDYLNRLIDTWSDEECVRNTQHYPGNRFERDYDYYKHNYLMNEIPAVAGLVAIISEIDVTSSNIDKLGSKVIPSLKNRGIPTCAIEVMLLRFVPEMIPLVVDSIRRALVSEDFYSIQDATFGLHWWINERRRGVNKIIGIPEEILHIIVLRVENCVELGLPSVLAVVSDIFEYGDVKDTDGIRSKVLVGLAKLFDLVQYESPSFDPSDLPIIRYYCFKLAQTLDKKGFGNELSVRVWLEIQLSDPLPEIKYA